MEEAREEPIMDFSKDYDGFVDPSTLEEAEAIINQFKYT